MGPFNDHRLKAFKVTYPIVLEPFPNIASSLPENFDYTPNFNLQRSRNGELQNLSFGPTLLVQAVPIWLVASTQTNRSSASNF